MDASIPAGALEPTPVTRVSRAKAIAAITIGNGLEFFDFTVYSFFATIIAKLYFPVEGQLAQLMLAAGTFGVGFIMRPIGGIVLGAYADRAGRKAGMSMTLWLMTIGSAIIAFAQPTRPSGWQRRRSSSSRGWCRALRWAARSAPPRHC